jgi:dual specificity phosphatase 12
MPHTCRFIDEALRSGGVVLVHGVHGLSRGATIMAAYRTLLVSHLYADLLTLCCASDVVKTHQCCRRH